MSESMAGLGDMYIAVGVGLFGLCVGVFLDRHLVPDWIALVLFPFAGILLALGTSRRGFVPKALRGARLVIAAFLVCAGASLLIWKFQPTALSLRSQGVLLPGFPGSFFLVFNIDGAPPTLPPAQYGRAVPLGLLAEISVTNESDLDERIVEYRAQARTGFLPIWKTLL
jgi:hypothetical protein